jgi:hypothetical protein
MALQDMHPPPSGGPLVDGIVERPIEVAPLLANFYNVASPPLRQRLLQCLLKPVGPLALVALAAGAFGRLLPRGRWQEVTVTLDDVAGLSAAQVYELAQYVDQKSPETFEQIGALVAGNAMAVSTVSGLLLMVALRAWARRNATHPH